MSERLQLKEPRAFLNIQVHCLVYGIKSTVYYTYYFHPSPDPSDSVLLCIHQSDKILEMRDE